MPQKASTIGCSRHKYKKEASAERNDLPWNQEKLEDLLLLSLSASKGQEGTLGGSGCGSDQGPKPAGGHRQIQWGHRRTADTRNGDTKLLAGYAIVKLRRIRSERSWLPGGQICGDTEKSADRFV